MDFLSFLRSSEWARKVFGKRELNIIEKQFNGVNLTQSEKNRLSRDIRAKLRFIKDASLFATEFDLKKGSHIRMLINDAVDTISDDVLFSKVEKIILFGSAVNNRLTLTSDIDLAVMFTTIDLAEATLFRKRILGRVSQRIDVQVYNVLDEKIIKEINENGKVIYKK